MVERDDDVETMTNGPHCKCMALALFENVSTYMFIYQYREVGRL